MKKLIFTLSLLVGAFFSLMANPAYPGKIPYRQPDGTVVYVRQHGDEWYHYTTDDKGRFVELGEDGFLRETTGPSYSDYLAAMNRRRQAWSPVNRSWTPYTDMTIGERRIPVFLIQFKDKQFTISNPQTSFTNLLNQKGYSYNGATGSVKDYYEENSHRQFRPIFDVFSPVTVSGNVADYGGSGYAAGARRALLEAAAALDSSVDFTQYDANNDGVVDLILFYFAGYNQADGGGTYNKNTIWPHRSSVSSSQRFDGKRLSMYFCTSEYQGYTGDVMCGIGTTCHEFAHSLGLPDFYDTDYEENGQAGALYDYSLMCSGSRNNNENTPPYLGFEELRMLGWLNSVPAIEAPGSYTLESVSNYVAYTLPASAEGEYFVLEARSKTGWDAALPGEGLLVYHVDKSPSHRIGSYTAEYLWDHWESGGNAHNIINAAGDHPCYYLISAANPASLNYTGPASSIPFPGDRIIREYVPADWDGTDPTFWLSGIEMVGEQVSFDVLGASPALFGKVLDSAGKPIQGASVSLYSAGSAAANHSASAPWRAARVRASAPLSSAVTDANGCYAVHMDGQSAGSYVLSVSCSGYVSDTQELDLPNKALEWNVYLLKTGETVSSDLYRFDSSRNMYYYGSSAGTAHSVAIRYAAEELGLYKGKLLKSISVYTRGTYNGTAVTGDLYVFVEVDGERIFTQKVTTPQFGSFQEVDVSAQNYLIRSGETFIGCGIINGNAPSPFVVAECEAVDKGYIAYFDTATPRAWTDLGDSNGYYTPVISAKTGAEEAGDLGFCYIDNPGNGRYAAGSRFSFHLVEASSTTPQSVTWYYDGVLTQASSVSLTAGSHQIEARLRFSDGTTERIYLTIQVQ